MSLQVTEVACLTDNYAYLVGQEGSTEAVVVDPSEAGPVKAALGARGLTLRAVLNTHHHPDHTGGNLELVREFEVPVYAYTTDRSRIPGCTMGLVDEERFEVAGLQFQVFHVPGHTQGAIAYVTQGVCFTGDTLFCGGCGRLKEGTAPQLFHSLERLKRVLDPATVCYVGHEYTSANLSFACALEPDNAAVRERLEQVQAARARGSFTAAAPLSLELSTNPFLRAAEPALALAAGLPVGTAPAEVFASLRRKKDCA